MTLYHCGVGDGVITWRCQVKHTANIAVVFQRAKMPIMMIPTSSLPAIRPRHRPLVVLVKQPTTDINCFTQLQPTDPTISPISCGMLQVFTPDPYICCSISPSFLLVKPVRAEKFPMFLCYSPFFNLTCPKKACWLNPILVRQ